MSTRKKGKSKKRIKRNALSMVLVCVIAIIIVWFVTGYKKLDTINKKYESEIEILQEQASNKKRELTLKKAQINYYKSDEYIEKIAREEAGLVMPNELVFIQSE